MINSIKNILPYGENDNSYQSAGGSKGIELLCNDFYDFIETLPLAKDIKDMHNKPFSHSRNQLTLFLSAWLGGPRDYFEQGGEGMIKVHQHLTINDGERDNWLICMFKAIDKQTHFSDDFKIYLKEQIEYPAHKIHKSSQKRNTEKD